MIKTFRSITMCGAAAVVSIGAGQSLAQIPTFPDIKKPIIKPTQKPKPIYQFNQAPIKPMLATKVTMLDGRLDATLIRPDGIALFLVNDNYAGYDIYNKKLKFTREHNQKNLSGVPNNIDAALLHPINKKGYFFKGNTYYRYDFFNKKTDKIGRIGKDGWKGISGPIDAALAHPYNNHVYFFKGNQYQKFSMEKRKIVARGTVGVDDWTGIPEDIDGAFLHSNGKAYFFKGNTYHRYDFAKNRRDKKGVVGKDGWRNVQFEKDNRATENTNENAQKAVRLRVTLKGIRALVGDFDGIEDLAYAGSIQYKALDKNKTFVQRHISLLKEPEIVISGNQEKDNSEHLIITGNGTGIIKYSGRPTDDLTQLHIARRQTKLINNYIDFLVSVDESSDQQATFFIINSIEELDDCGGIFWETGCDAELVARNSAHKVPIYQILKYLKNPKSFPKDHLKEVNSDLIIYNSVNDSLPEPTEGRDYGPNVMKLKKDTDGGLVGWTRDGWVESYYHFQLVE